MTRTEKILSLLGRGLNDSEIARQVGCSATYVSRLGRERGFARHPEGWPTGKRHTAQARANISAAKRAAHATGRYA